MLFEDLDIVVHPALPDRIETGPVQFGPDWPGLFVRGEDALVLAHGIERVLDLLKTLPKDVTFPLMAQIGACVQLSAALRATQL